MSRVTIYADRLGRTAPTGVGVYTARLLEQLPEVAPDLDLSAVTLPEELPATVRHDGLRTRYVARSRRRTALEWTLLRRPLLESVDRDTDLVHVLTTVSVPTRRPLIYTVHDLTPLLFPEQYSRRHRFLSRRALDLAVRTATHLISVSERTARDLTDRFGVDRERMTVVHLGFDGGGEPASEEAVASVRDQFGLDGPYVAYVGSITRRKNLVTLVQAFDEVRRAVPDAKLVLAGGAGLGADEVEQAVDDLGLGERVVLPGYVPDLTARALLRGAGAFAFPSIYEGFGIPPLEAMAQGTPVVASPAGSVEEVVGDAALLSPPDDPAQLAHNLIRVLRDADLADALRDRGTQRLKAFSWRRMAEETADVYRRVLRGR